MSVVSVQARIAEIQARLGVPAQRTDGAAFSAQLTSAQAGAATPTTATSSTSATVAAALGSPTAAPTAGAMSGVTDIASAALSRPAALRPPVKTSHHGKLEPPAELAAYGNGKIPPTALAEIGEGGHRMWAPAAAQFKQLRQDAAAAGVNIGVTDSYRSYDQQVDLAKRKGLYSQGGLAATPGTSNHGWGRSLDLDLDAKAQSWMRANAERYGFVEDVPREPWHWTFHGKG